MSEPHLEQVAALCRQAAETLDHHGSFRLRILMQMLLLELEKEQAAKTSARRAATRV